MPSSAAASAGGDAFDVAQDHHLALGLGQPGEQVVDPPGELLGDQALVDPLGPRHRWRAPRAGRVEAVDELVVGPPGLLLPTGARPGAVEEDPEEPGLERRAPLEALDAADDRHPRLLADLLGHGAAADGRLGQAEQPGLVAVDQFDERGLVAGLEPFDEPDVIVHAPGG